MEIFKVIKELIDKEITSGNTKFIIFPYGKAGAVVRSILDGYQNVTYILTDNKKKDTDIYNLETVCKEEYKEYKILFCCLNIEYYLDLKLQLERVALKEKIVDFYMNCFSDEDNTKNVVGKCGLLGLLDPRIGILERCAREIHYKNVMGNCAEAGVFRGTFARYINFWFPDKRLYLADTFEGFPKEDVEIERIKQYSDGKQDWSNTSIEQVLLKMPFANNCIIKKGRFPDCMQDVNDTFAYVSLDMDLYQPILAGLEYFYPRLSVGGYIMIHDCCNEGYPGARAAVEEYCKKQNIGYVIGIDDCGTAIITK